MDNIETDQFIFIPKEDMSLHDWLDSRLHGVGGSDVGTILGTNPWATATELFYQKLGLYDSPDLTSNKSVHWGNELESLILDNSQYYVPQAPEAYMRNKANGNKRNTHVELDYMVINKDYPWIQVNVDGIGWERIVDDWEFKDGNILPALDKVVEIKTISGRSRDTWEGGLPYSYILQVRTYMLALFPMNNDIFGEIYSLVDGSTLEYHLIEWNQAEASEILEKTYEFWETVEQGKLIRGECKTEAELLQALAQVEPKADGSANFHDFYSEFMLQKIDQEANAWKGSEDALDLAVAYKMLHDMAKPLNDAKQMMNNRLKQEMAKHGTTYIDFGEQGRVKISNNRLYVTINNYQDIYEYRREKSPLYEEAGC